MEQTERIHQLETLLAELKAKFADVEALVNARGDGAGKALKAALKESGSSDALGDVFGQGPQRVYLLVIYYNIY